MKVCEVSADLQRRCSTIETEAREAREKVAPLEKRVSDLVQESLEWNATTENRPGGDSACPEGPFLEPSPGGACRGSGPGFSMVGSGGRRQEACGRQ